jgi:hypothetical protein
MKEREERKKRVDQGKPAPFWAHLSRCSEIASRPGDDNRDGSRASRGFRSEENLRVLMTMVIKCFQRTRLLNQLIDNKRSSLAASPSAFQRVWMKPQQAQPFEKLNLDED